jgi:hypothetical protein
VGVSFELVGVAQKLLRESIILNEYYSYDSTNNFYEAPSTEKSIKSENIKMGVSSEWVVVSKKF